MKDRWDAGQRRRINIDFLEVCDVASCHTDGLMDVLLFPISNCFSLVHFCDNGNSCPESEALHLLLPPPSPAGSALRLFQLWTGGGSCGQLFQLPELRRVRALQRPLLRLDRVGVSGRQDGATRQVSDQTHHSDFARIFQTSVFVVRKARCVGKVAAEGRLCFGCLQSLAAGRGGGRHVGHLQPNVSESQISQTCSFA